MPSKTLLMYDHKLQRLIPVNEGIFKVSQFSNEKTINEKYGGNWVLYPDGKLLEISGVHFVGAYGDTFFKKLFNRLNSTYEIRVDLVDASASFAETKEKAILYATNDLASAEPYMPDQKIQRDIIDSLNSPAELYKIFKLPAPEDCLDVMV